MLEREREKVAGRREKQSRNMQAPFHLMLHPSLEYFPPWLSFDPIAMEIIFTIYVNIILKQDNCKFF